VARGNDRGAPWFNAFVNGADASKDECGSDYIEYAFRFARAADSNAILYINEGALQRRFVDGIAALVIDINDRWAKEGNKRPLIEGIGMQCHISINSDLSDVEYAIKTFAATGAVISITELDVTLADWWIGETAEPIAENLHKQAEMYAELFIMFKKYSKHIERVTFWGHSDAQHWLPGNYAAIFDENFNPKPAYFAVADPEGYLRGDYDTPVKRKAWIAANSD
jgi:endo-1,4-beta-xylanase